MDKKPEIVVVEIDEAAPLQSPMDRAKLARYRVATVIGSIAWVLIEMLATYAAIKLIQTVIH
jgi:membrane protein DedA with SNARE-associated domain